MNQFLRILFIILLLKDFNASNILWNSSQTCQYTFDCDSADFTQVQNLYCDQNVNRQIGKSYFYETFSQVQLEPSLNFQNNAHSQNSYTQNFPNGWILDNSKTDLGGCSEYQGLTIVNRNWWYTGGDSLVTQGRNNFTPGTCQNIIIGDNDNYNCFTNTGKYQESSLTSSVINLSGLKENELFLIFDNSWKYYPNAESYIEISFDNQEFQKIFIQQSSGAYAKSTVYQETLLVPTFNFQGVQTAQLRFTYKDNNNGWWWGIARIGLFSYPCKNGYQDDGYGGLQCINIEDCTPIGTGCFTEDKVQACFDYLQDLTENTINNECNVITINEQINYNFILKFDKESFIFDPTCIEAEIQFEGQVLDQQDWEFDNLQQIFIFTKLHKDIVDLGCEYYENQESYLWQCDMSLHIKFAGAEQLVYQYKMKSTMSRQVNSDIQAIVQRKINTGQCCENKLSIDHLLRFCKTFECNEYYTQSPLEISRMEEFYVEHRLTTKEFQHYYMHHVSLYLGPFLPDILAKNASEQGRIIYKIRSNVALGSITLSAISMISDYPQESIPPVQNQNNNNIDSSSENNRRRILDEIIGNNYELKGEQPIIIIDQNKNIQQNNKQQENLQNNKINNQKETNQQKSKKIQLIKQIIFWGAISIFISCFATIIIYKIYKKRKNLQQNSLQLKKNENNNNSDGNKSIQSNQDTVLSSPQTIKLDIQNMSKDQDITNNIQTQQLHKNQKYQKMASNTNTAINSYQSSMREINKGNPEI